MGDRWGPEGPPQEAYSRVTNPERFQPLISYTEDLLDRLERDYVVTRREGGEVDRDFSIKEPSRPAVRLVPDDEDAAPIAIAFSSFPGLSVRVGHWYEENFPHCGCDACDETAAWCQAEIGSLIGDVVHGRMAEYIDVPVIGGARLGSRRWGPGGRSSGWRRIQRKEAKTLIARAGERSFEYAPWPRKDG